MDQECVRGAGFLFILQHDWMSRKLLTKVKSEYDKTETAVLLSTDLGQYQS